MFVGSRADVLRSQMQQAEGMRARQRAEANLRADEAEQAQRLAAQNRSNKFMTDIKEGAGNAVDKGGSFVRSVLERGRQMYEEDQKSQEELRRENAERGGSMYEGIAPKSLGQMSDENLKRGNDLYFDIANTILEERAKDADEQRKLMEEQNKLLQGIYQESKKAWGFS